METPTLKSIRESAGLTLAEAVKLIRERVPSAPTTPTGLHHLERRGTPDIRVLAGMAQVYGKSLEEVAVAAGNSLPSG